MLLAAGADVNTRLLEFSDHNYTHTAMEVAIEGNCVRLWPHPSARRRDAPTSTSRDFPTPIWKESGSSALFGLREGALTVVRRAVGAEVSYSPRSTRSHVVSFWAHVGDYWACLRRSPSPPPQERHRRDPTSQAKKKRGPGPGRAREKRRLLERR